jgi:hypothetical protein
MPGPQVLVDTSIKLRVDVVAGTGTVTPSPAHVKKGRKVIWELELTNNPGDADVRAYLAVAKFDLIVPDQTTSDHGLQGVLFPFQDNGGSSLKPTFDAIKAGSEQVFYAIVFPGSQKLSQPVNSVVIIDM